MKAKVKEPNVIIILTDDQGYNDLSIQGSKEIKTPHIDRMAKEGLRLTNFHAQPVCGPSRAALLTGCYPQRIGQVGNRRLGVGGGHPLIHPKEVTIAKMLKDTGYATAAIGKWHLGMENDNRPNDMGFDYFLGTAGSNDGAWCDLNQFCLADGINLNDTHEAYPQLPLIENNEIIEFPVIQRGITTRYTDKAIEFIDKSNKEETPFFLYLAHNMPHIPLFPSKQFEGVSEYGVYGDCVEEIDWNVGRILDKLRQLEIEEDTLVVFTSDNGPWLRPDLIETRECGSAYPLRGGKVTSWEGGFRVPCVIWMPGTIKGERVSDYLTSTLDLFPTIATLCSARLPCDRTIDGLDISSFLLKGRQEVKDKIFFFYVGRNLQAVQRGKWKVVLKRPALPELMDEYWASHFSSVEEHQLFDLESDIGETTNVADKFPEILNDLLKESDHMIEELGEGKHIGVGERFWEKQPTPGLAEVDQSWSVLPLDHNKVIINGMVFEE